MALLAILVPRFKEKILMRVFPQAGAFEHPPGADESRVVPPPTPVRFPRCIPKTEHKAPSVRKDVPLVALLQAIHRPSDIKLSHFEALGLHVISDASPEDLIPDSSYLPPVDAWNSLPADDLLELNESTQKPLNNGKRSPGVQTYRERQKELLIDNTAAFRTIRRLPPPTGAVTARLGNAYEFFKILEFFSSYWIDTSLPTPSAEDEQGKVLEAKPLHLKTHVRTGTGTQLPPDNRQQLLASFVKLVAYDFGCSVSFPRIEPRLHLTPPSTSRSKSTPPPSSFNSSATFIFRTPTDRASARAAIFEGPVAALSARASTVFSRPEESELDLAREVVAILLTAQHRARGNKTEKRFGEGKWWTTIPRWGGGSGGPIGREGDNVESSSRSEKSTSTKPLPTKNEAAPSEKKPTTSTSSSSSVTAESKRAIGGILNKPSSSTPSTNKRSKRTTTNGNLPFYEAYRRMNPPSSTWDHKMRYFAIGKPSSPTTNDTSKSQSQNSNLTEEEQVSGSYDDVFLLSSLNHHISIVRARVPESLLEVLNGAENERGWERFVVWRSKWFDLFVGEERVQAMGLVWGMMSYLMRKMDVEEVVGKEEEKMDLS